MARSSAVVRVVAGKSEVVVWKRSGWAKSRWKEMLAARR